MGSEMCIRDSYKGFEVAIIRVLFYMVGYVLGCVNGCCELVV